MSITINDPQLEARLAEIGKKQLVGVSKTRIAFAILKAASVDLRKPNHWQKLLPSQQTVTSNGGSDTSEPTNINAGANAPVGHSSLEPRGEHLFDATQSAPHQIAAGSHNQSDSLLNDESAINPPEGVGGVPNTASSVADSSKQSGNPRKPRKLRKLRDTPATIDTLAPAVGGETQNHPPEPASPSNSPRPHPRKSRPQKSLRKSTKLASQKVPH